MSASSPLAVRPPAHDVPRNVFVLGLDDHNRALLEALPDAARRYRFHTLLDYHDVRGVDEFPVEEWLDEARSVLDRFAGSVDAIVSFWDFPLAEMACILCAERGLRSASLEASLRCQHKYWSRLVQHDVLPSSTPRFTAVDPFADDADAIDLDYPYWLKPVRSFRSYLGFRIGNARERARALDAIRDGIDRIADPFDDILRRVELPPEIEALSAHHCIAEEIIGGQQCTVEGYVHDGEVHAYGLVDSIRAPNRTTFTRYQYPSKLPRRIRARMADTAARVITATGYDDAPFNAELFYDRRRDRIRLLEINSRLSQSHAELFERVDGVSHHQVMVDLALGERPRPPEVVADDGRFRCAAKFFLRAWDDGVVTSAPTPEQIDRIEETVPGCSIHLAVEEGTRLAELPDQDSYSYELGVVFVGAQRERDLLRKYRAVQEGLVLEVAAAAQS